MKSKMDLTECEKIIEQRVKNNLIEEEIIRNSIIKEDRKLHGVNILRCH